MKKGDYVPQQVATVSGQIASITLGDALILGHRANQAGWIFRNRHGLSDHSDQFCPRGMRILSAKTRTMPSSKTRWALRPAERRLEYRTCVQPFWTQCASGSGRSWKCT